MALHGIVGERQIERGARQGPHVVEARNEGERAGARQAAISRLEAEEAAEGGRHADGSVGVRPQRDRHQAARDGAAGAARGAAGHAAEIMRIARGPVVDVLAGEVVGVLAHVERSHQHGAGRLEPPDQRGIAAGRWPVPVDLGAGQSGEAD